MVHKYKNDSNFYYTIQFLSFYLSQPFVQVLENSTKIIHMRLQWRQSQKRENQGLV